MKLRRPHRLFVVIIALFSVLFMQLALASYACPGMSLAGSNIVTGARMDTGFDVVAMLGCDGMDQNQLALCHAHAQNELAKQSLDQPSSPHVQAFVSGQLFAEVVLADVLAIPLSSQSHSAFFTRTAAPPLSIQHCCFRI